MNRTTSKSIMRKNEILIAAQELFNTKGFLETSISDIMKKAGAAKGTFYYYFETKAQILDTLVDMHIDETVEAMKTVAGNNVYNPLQKLEAILQEAFKISIANLNPGNHLHNIKNVDMHQKILVKTAEQYAPVFAEVVEQGIREGIFNTKNPLEVCEIIISGIYFITDLGIFQWDNTQYLKRIKASEEIIERALGIKEGSFAFLSEMLKSMPSLVNKESKE